MKVRIVLSGQIAHKAGTSEVEQEVAEGARLADVLTAFGEDHGAAAPYLKDATLLVAIDGSHATDRSLPVPAGTREILLMSPMAGG